jgi:AraC-like DNA-binding protein
MYKSVSTDIKKMALNAKLYSLHKTGISEQGFGMDNTAELLEGGFGLYSTVNVKSHIGPIKAEFFRIAFTRAGTACMEIGLERFKPRRNSIFFGFPGQIFSLHDLSEDFLTYYMLFSEAFITEALMRQDKKHPFPFLSYTGLQCFELDDETAAEVEAIIFKMDHEIKRQGADSAVIIRLYIQLILAHAHRCYKQKLLVPDYSFDSSQLLFQSYLRLVGQHFVTVRRVAEYAQMLHVSPDHLNRTIKSCSEKTAHELIEEMLLREAKAYLLHSTLSISEIAYRLEFADPPHFNRFFKKLAGQTPLEYRKGS